MTVTRLGDDTASQQTTCLSINTKRDNQIKYNYNIQQCYSAWLRESESVSFVHGKRKNIGFICRTEVCLIKTKPPHPRGDFSVERPNTYTQTLKQHREWQTHRAKKSDANDIPYKDEKDQLTDTLLMTTSVLKSMFLIKVDIFPLISTCFSCCDSFFPSMLRWVACSFTPVQALLLIYMPVK